MRQHLGEVVVKPQLARHRLGDDTRIAGEHDAADAHGLQAPHRLEGLGTDDVGEGDGGNGAIVQQQIDHRLALLRQARDPRVVHGDAVAAQVAGAHHLHFPAAGARRHPLAGQGAELLDGLGGETLGLHGLGDATRDRVLRLPFQGPGQGQGACLVQVGIEHHHVAHTEAALGEGAGLVEDHRIQLPRPLEGRPIADEEAAARPQGGAHRHHQGHRQAEGVWTGDDHHRDHALQGEFEFGPQDQPHDESEGARADGDVGEPLGGAVGQVLGARSARLRLAHQADDLREVGVLAGLAHLDEERTLAVDGAADDLVPLALGHRPRLAGEHGFVEAAAPLDDHPVGGDLLPGSYQDPVAGAQHGHRHVLDAVAVGQPVGDGGHELDQGLQGTRGAHHRTHLDPVPEKHDVDEGGQFPEEDLAGEA